MSHTLKLLISEERIQARIKELGRQISEDYKDQPLVCVCVLKGAFLFFADLVRELTNSPEVDFVRLASYGKGTTRGSDIIFSKDLEVSIEGKHVLIVEDIVDSGHSMEFLTHVFSRRAPKSLKICALVDKHERREANLKVDYSGFAENGFIVGFGLDYAEKFRELKAIYELVNE